MQAMFRKNFLSFIQNFYSNWEVNKACLLVESQSELYIFMLSQDCGFFFYTIEQHSLKLLKN